mmetsp:Transcript_24956/g.47227  ORF Transcript_24956/g.47227 Transcript_24956/m.47227 type:complete len:184 (+) Transcript_24956:28-579(+)
MLRTAFRSALAQGAHNLFPLTVSSFPHVPHMQTGGCSKLVLGSQGGMPFHSTVSKFEELIAPTPSHNYPHMRVRVPDGYESYEDSLYKYTKGAWRVAPTSVLQMYIQASPNPLTASEMWTLVENFGKTPETGAIWSKTQMKKLLSQMRKQKQVKMIKSDQKVRGTSLFRMMYSVGDRASMLTA